MFEIMSQKLSKSKIPHMPVKGWYLRNLYPVPELRTFGDIDILINKQDRKKADEIFTILMGDEVEPRRKFIEENAVYVQNLDI